LQNPIIKFVKRDYDDPEQMVINTIEGSLIKSDDDNEKDMLELVCRVYNINEGHGRKH